MKGDEQDYPKKDHEGKHGAGYGQAEVPRAKKFHCQKWVGQPGLDGDKTAQGSRSGSESARRPTAGQVAEARAVSRR